MSRQNKKERQRLKRKKKQAQLRKERNTSIFQKLSRQPGPVEIYINAGWREAGEATLMCMRDAPGGGRVFVSFLIDFWCSGLKDAYGHSGMTRQEFEDYLNNADDRGLEMSSLDLAAAQRMVAGAMRLSVQNGFRLPRRADRWASVIGVTSYADADLADFEKPDGKYRYVGSMQDLRKRLVGSVDQFLQRRDVEFAIHQYTPFDDEFDNFAEGGWTPAENGDVDHEDDDEDHDDAIDDQQAAGPAEVFEQIEEICERAYVAIYNWLVGAGKTPHPRLRDGIDVALAAAILERTAQEFPASRLPPAPDLNKLLEPYDDSDSVVAASTQVIEYMQQFESPQRMLEALGFGGDPGTELAESLPLPPR
jgi:hypothetical protein